MFRRWADERLIAENQRLREENRKLRSLARVQQFEIDELAAVIARNQKRIEAETANAARVIAGDGNEANGKPLRIY